MRILPLAFFLIVVTARAADTPLSAILIDGEGWQMAGDTMFDFPREVYRSKKDDKGRWSLYLGEKRVAEAEEGETFGDATLSPNGGLLVLGVPSHHYLYSFRVGKDGSLSAKEKCYVLRREGTGGSAVRNMVFDNKGRLFVAMPGGVQYFDEEMRFSGHLSRPERAEVRFVFLAGDTLFVSCGAGVWKRKIKATAPK